MLDFDVIKELSLISLEKLAWFDLLPKDSETKIQGQLDFWGGNLGISRKVRKWDTERKKSNRRYWSISFSLHYWISIRLQCAIPQQSSKMRDGDYCIYPTTSYLIFVESGTLTLQSSDLFIHKPIVILWRENERQKKKKRQKKKTHQAMSQMLKRNALTLEGNAKEIWRKHLQQSYSGLKMWCL